MQEVAIANKELIVGAADVILKYGFLGVGLVLSLGIAPAAYKFWRSRQVALTTFSFGLAFIVAWGVLDIVQKNFPWLISSKRALVSGVVLNVPNGFQVQVSSDLRRVGAAYLKRQFDARNREVYNFPFLLLSSDAPDCLSIAITNNNPESETGSSGFNIEPISADDLKSNMALVARAERVGDGFQLRFWREVGDRQVGDAKILKPLANNVEGCSFGTINSSKDRASGGWLLPAAFAQSGPDLNAHYFAVGLKSDDLFTRRAARIELSKQGQQAFTLADQFLKSNNYRLQLGALVALSIMPQAEQRKLPVDLQRQVLKFRSNGDPTIRETANRINAASVNR